MCTGGLSLAAASKLDKETGKYSRGFSFAAVWGTFLVIFLATVGQYVLGGSARGCAGKREGDYSTPLMTGFWLGKYFLNSKLIGGCDEAASTHSNSHH